jgi:hypothetical protein
MTRPLRLSLIALVAVALSGAGNAALAQNPHAAPPVAAKTQTVTPAMTPPAGQMMANMEADQKKLDDLVAAMNAATGTDKIDKIAAVVAELSRQNGMCSRMMKDMMGGGMMKMGGEKMVAPQAAPPATPGQDSGHEQHHPKY